MNQLTGVLGTMEPEVRGLVAAMAVEESSRGAGFDYWRGRLAGHECVVARCGMGKVSAAAGVQRLIDQFSISRLVVCGLAGGLQVGLDIGDVVVGERFVQYDLDTSPIYPRFEAPGLGAAFFAAAAAGIEASPRVHRGLIVTGDQFVRDDKRLELLRDFPDALCVEMEGRRWHRSLFQRAAVRHRPDHLGPRRWRRCHRLQALRRGSRTRLHGRYRLWATNAPGMRRGRAVAAASRTGRTASRPPPSAP